MSLPAEVTRRIGPRNLRRVVYDAETIRRRIAELGREITGAYPGGDLLLVGLLRAVSCSWPIWCGKSSVPSR